MLRGHGSDQLSPRQSWSSTADSGTASRPPSMQSIPGSSPTQIRRLPESGYASPLVSPQRLEPTTLEPLHEYHSGFADADIAFPSTATHRRQHSFPNLLPLAFRSRTPSPVRKTQHLADPMPLTGDSRSGSPRNVLAGWLSGTSSPAVSGTEERAMTPAMHSRASSQDITPDMTPTRLRRSTTSVPEPAKRAVTTASRFMSAISRFAQPPTNPDLDDELCSLNVEAALFSPISPSTDTFSPAAYKNLQMNAVGLLTKMQAAYRDKVMALKEVEGERGAQKDELEESSMRVEHLKMQLEGMARKAAENEMAMQGLVQELAAEKKARADDQRLIRERGLQVPTEGSMVSEDLGAEDDQLRRKWRKSDGTVKSEETTFETDDESIEEESVFSRSRSPTTAPNVPEIATMDELRGQPRNAARSVPKAKATTQLSAFQKIIKGISGDAEPGLDGCRNCRGQDASMAWDTVGLLRDENKHLKHRIGDLEDAVEGALDMVRGVGL